MNKEEKIEKVEKVVIQKVIDSEPLKYVWEYVHVTPRGIRENSSLEGTGYEKSDYMTNPDYQDRVMILCEHLKNNIFFNDMTKIIEIKPELKDLLFYTKNKIFPRKPFYHKMFFNTDVVLEGYHVKGFYVEWIPERQDLQIMYVAVDKNEMAEFWGNFQFIPDERDEQNIFTDNKREERLVRKIREDIRMVIANIIDFINHPQDKIEVIHQDRNEKTNIKRMKKKKHPINSKIWLRPHPQFKEHLRTYNERNKSDHSFSVRGHWRHFHADRFKVTKPIWIDPFVKNKDKKYINKRVVMSK